MEPPGGAYGRSRGRPKPEEGIRTARTIVRQKASSEAGERGHRRSCGRSKRKAGAERREEVDEADAAGRSRPLSGAAHASGPDAGAWPGPVAHGHAPRCVIRRRVGPPHRPWQIAQRPQSRHVRDVNAQEMSARIHVTLPSASSPRRSPRAHRAGRGAMKDSNSPDQAIDGENGAFEELDGTARNSERHVLMAGGAPAPVGDKRAARRAEVENFGPSTSEGSGAAPGEGVGIEAATGTHVIATPFPTERPERPVWLTDAHRCSTCKGRRFHLNPDTYFDRELWTWTRSCASCLAKRRSERRTGNRKAGRRTMTLEARRQATLRAQEASLRRTEAQIQAAASIHDGKSPAVGRGRPLRASARRARERGFGYKDAGGLDGEDPGASTSKPGERSGSPDAGASRVHAACRVWLTPAISTRILMLTPCGRALAAEDASCLAGTRDIGGWAGR